MGKKKCFIITPIGNANEPIRRHIDGIIKAAIRPVLEDEYEINVAHEMNKVGSINKQVIEEILTSDLVIANLTNKNPNVMYELAFRHCLGKPVIQIMEEGTVLPFDIGTERTIPYINDSQGVLELRDNINKFINEMNFADNKQGPIYDVLKVINYESNILKAIESDPINNANTDILKYLVDKISRIESKVDRSNNTKKLRNGMRNFIEVIHTSDNVSDEILNKLISDLLKYDKCCVEEVTYGKESFRLYLNKNVEDEQDYLKSLMNLFKQHGIDVSSIYFSN